MDGLYGFVAHSIQPTLLMLIILRKKNNNQRHQSSYLRVAPQKLRR